MKKYNKFGYAGAMMLAGLVSFSSCSSDDEIANVNPTYDGKSVKTEFAISVPKAYTKGGRMTADATQIDGKFLGMEKLYAFGFAVVPGSVKDQSFADPRIDMGVLEQNDINEKTGNSKWSKNVSIAEGT